MRATTPPVVPAAEMIMCLSRTGAPHIVSVTFLAADAVSRFYLEDQWLTQLLSDGAAFDGTHLNGIN